MKLIGYSALSFWAAVTCVLSLAVAAAPAQAQPFPRTWVSNTGDDDANCLTSSPCRTFDGALDKTQPGGQISCLDSGSYGSVQINKSVTIDCTGTFALASSGLGSAIFISDASTGTPGTIVVRLRGLTINGHPEGTNGIRFTRGAALIVEDVFIQNELAGSGIQIAPNAGTVLVSVSNTTVANSGSGPTGGIEVRPIGNGFARVNLRNVQVIGSTGNGVRLDSTATTGLGILAFIEDSDFSSSGAAGLSVAAGAGPSPFNVTLIKDSSISNNGGAGISTTGAAARVRVRDTTISLNGTGVSPGTGFINDLGDNVNLGNSADGAFN